MYNYQWHKNIFSDAVVDVPSRSSSTLQKSFLCSQMFLQQQVLEHDTLKLIKKYQRRDQTIHSCNLNKFKNVHGAEKFQQKYLHTSPEANANYLLKQLPRGTQRMVFGQDSFKTWMGATLIALKWMNRIMWSEVKKVIDLTPYVVLKKHK